MISVDIFNVLDSKIVVDIMNIGVVIYVSGCIFWFDVSMKF